MANIFMILNMNLTGKKFVSSNTAGTQLIDNNSKSFEMCLRKLFALTLKVFKLLYIKVFKLQCSWVNLYIYIFSSQEKYITNQQVTSKQYLNTVVVLHFSVFHRNIKTATVSRNCLEVMCWFMIYFNLYTYFTIKQ